MLIRPFSAIHTASGSLQTCHGENARDHVGGQTFDSHRGEMRLGAIVRAAAAYIYASHEREFAYRKFRVEGSAFSRDGRGMFIPAVRM